MGFDVEVLEVAEAQVFRVFEDVRFLDSSQFKIDQRKRYEETRVYGGKMDGITLPTWETLKPWSKVRSG